MFEFLFGRKATEHIPNIDARELRRMLHAEENFLLIDVRSAAEYEHDGHVVGSRLLPLHALPQRLEELPRDKKLVFICRSGNRSLVACEQLARLGFADVVNVSGGMVAWKRAGFAYR